MAGSNYFNSDRSGYSGSLDSRSWNDFYSGIAKPSSRPQSYAGQDRALPSRLPQGTAGLPNPSPGSGLTPAQVQALGGYSVDPRTGQLAYAPPSPQNPALAAIGSVVSGVPLPRPRPGYAPTRLDMAAINTPPAMPLDSAIPTPANPAVAAALAGRLAPKPLPRPKISATALINGRRGLDNEPGANYQGRSVGSDGIVRAYNNETKRFESVDPGRKKSPSESYKKDSLGDRDMRQSSKQKYDY